VSLSLFSTPVILAPEAGTTVVVAVFVVTGITFLAAPITVLIFALLFAPVILAFEAAAAIAISIAVIAGIAFFAARLGLNLRHHTRDAARRQRSGC
jgi:K+-sensing histidine kinase KdpD